MSRIQAASCRVPVASASAALSEWLPARLKPPKTTRQPLGDMVISSVWPDGATADQPVLFSSSVTEVWALGR
jgi:hypothetical protein